MRELIAATRNRGKLAEMRALLEPYGIRVIGQDEAGIHVDVVEDGETFRDNAQKKATAIAKLAGVPALADDSGLCVDALGGQPGVYSARYAGEGATDDDRMRKLLDALSDVPEQRRAAHFHCAICLAEPDGTCLHFSGRVDGVILREKRGADGFGYDPIFWYPPLGKTFAELSGDEKNAISHRGRALAQLAQYFENATPSVPENEKSGASPLL